MDFADLKYVDPATRRTMFEKLLAKKCGTERGNLADLARALNVKGPYIYNVARGAANPGASLLKRMHDLPDHVPPRRTIDLTDDAFTAAKDEKDARFALTLSPETYEKLKRFSAQYSVKEDKFSNAMISKLFDAALDTYIEKYQKLPEPDAFE